MFSWQGEILDTTVLLRTCVQSAVGMLRDQNEDLSRSRRRIEILLGLFSKEDELRGVCCRECPGRLETTKTSQSGPWGSKGPCCGVFPRMCVRAPVCWWM